MSNARGSAYELLDHLITAEAGGLIPAELLQEGRELVDRAVRLLNGYLKYLKGKAGGSRDWWMVIRNWVADSWELRIANHE